jgi:hypothetical protein
VSDLLSRTLSASYSCVDFLADAWEAETGTKLDVFVSLDLRRRFDRLSDPKSPCVVLLRRARLTPHVGLFVRGRVLHLSDSGPIRQLLPLAAIGYSSVRFYAPR